MWNPFTGPSHRAKGTQTHPFTGPSHRAKGTQSHPFTGPSHRAKGTQTHPFTSPPFHQSQSYRGSSRWWPASCSHVGPVLRCVDWNWKGVHMGDYQPRTSKTRPCDQCFDRKQLQIHIMTGKSTQFCSREWLTSRSRFYPLKNGLTPIEN